MEPASYVAGSGDVANPAVHFGLSGARARAPGSIAADLLSTPRRIPGLTAACGQTKR